MAGVVNVVQSRLIVLATVQVFFLAFMLSYFNVQIPWSNLELVSRLKRQFFGRSPSGGKLFQENGGKKRILLTIDQLAKYDGSPNAPGLYLALLGKIYDVSKGSKHYGPDGGYHFFAGMFQSLMIN